MRTALLLGLAVLTAGPVAAQEPWRSSYYPYVLGNPGDGVMLVARWQRTRNAPYFVSKGLQEDVINPLTFAGSVSIDAGAGTLGSRFGRVEFRAPGLVDGWRFRTVAAAERTGRYGYYGTGGEIESIPDGADANGNDYRVHRTRYLLQGEVTRRVAGDLRVAFGAFLDWTALDALDDASGRFRVDQGPRYSRTNLILRPALVYDSRDREYTPSRGVLVEVGGGLGTGGDSAHALGGSRAYGLGYAQVKGYVSIREGTVVALRLLAIEQDDHAPLSARFTVPGWERELSLAGTDGHRSFPAGALAGTGARLASLEVRHDILNAGDLGAITALAFADFARIDDPSAARERTEQFGGGGGLAIRVLRSAVLNLAFAGGANGFNFSMGTAWAF